jgi:leader peptidase (prepilin peptidase) / N-methyltransferase
MDLLDSDLARWIAAVWFVFVGGAVGSFLNVVVYRLPAGMSTSWPGSHCPLCKHSIRPYDNIPVLAWLWLRGRCRDCHQPISARYPLVEAATAGLFLLLLEVEVFHNGRNLPVRPLMPQPIPAAYFRWLCLLHLGLLCTLLAAALIRFDGKRPPRRLFMPLLLAGLIAPAIFPWLHPVPAGIDSAATPWPWPGIIDSLTGLAIAFLLGKSAAWLGKRLAGIGQPGNQLLGEGLMVGLVLGWQAVVPLLPLVMLLEELSRIAALRWPVLRRLTAAVWLAPMTLLWILNWAQLAAWLRFG